MAQYKNVSAGHFEIKIKKLKWGPALSDPDHGQIECEKSLKHWIFSHSGNTSRSNTI